MVEGTSKDRYHHGRLREALVEAAWRLVDERGLQALTLRRLAQLVGVTHAAPYRHFRNKAELIAAVATAGFERLAIDLARVADVAAMIDRPGAGQPASPPSWLVHFGEIYVDFAHRHPAQFHLMFPTQNAGVADPAVTAGRSKIWQQFLAASARLGPRGSSQPAASQRFAAILWCQLHGQATLNADRLLPVELRFNRLGAVGQSIEQLWKGFAPPRSPP